MSDKQVGPAGAVSAGEGESLSDQVAALQQALEDRDRDLLGLANSLELSNQYLVSILSEVADFLLVTDSAGVVLFSNRAANTVLQASGDEVVGRNVQEYLRYRGKPVDTDVLGRVVGDVVEMILTGAPDQVIDVQCMVSRIQVHAPSQKDAVLPVSAFAKLTAGNIYVLVARDIRERKHAMEKIRNLARFVEENPSIVMRIGLDLRLMYVNSAGRAFAQAHDCRVGKEVVGPLAEAVELVLETSRRCEREIDALGRCWSLSLIPVRGQNYINLYGTDITDRVQMEQKLLTSAFYDELTGLPNRALLRDHVEQALHSFRRRPEDKAFGLIEVDLDRFRYINETFGHTVGDELLKACAERLKDFFFARDTIARFSADAFCILQKRINSLDDLLDVGRRMLECLSEPFHIGEHELYVSACAGIVLPDANCESAEDLIRDADTALYRAKDVGRGNLMIFDDSMQERMRRFLSLEGRLRNAIRRDEFVMHYQPKVNVGGELCGFEALIRWPDPEGGLISPAEFVPVAEDSGLIIELGHWVNNAVCAQINVWQQNCARPVPVAINISGQQFEQKGFVRNFRQILDDHHVSGDMVQAEITESSLMGDIWNVVKRLRKLAESGVVSAIDDFGTGYSSLAYLKQFPVSYLKVDQAFVRNMHENEEDYAITSAIVAMAHQLRLKVIAEGVENETQLAMLSALDCDQIQGYYFSKPLPAERATQIIELGGIY